MTKVVINRCFGGFGLSMAAVEEYLKRKGKQAFFFSHVGNKLVPVTPGEDSPFYFSTRTNEDLTDAESYWHWSNLERSDPDLVAVVEELGEAANGRHAELKVVEIPDGIEYGIEEYDGIEWVAEKHRTWS